MSGPGAMRVLVLELEPRASLRETFALLAHRLSSRTPHVLWTIAAVTKGGNDVGFALWSGDRTPPRVAALVVDRRHVVASDVESIRGMAAVLAHDASNALDALVYRQWLDLLGRDALTRRFYRELEQMVARLARDASGSGSEDERAELALLTTSRLLFLAFLEAKGWLDGDRAFLARQFDGCMSRGGAFHRNVLLPLCFGTLNTPWRKRAPLARRFGAIPFLNGGLFARTTLERRLRSVRFDDASLGALLGDLLGRYRFTAHEESASLAEVAVDPEMLGRAFESLMMHRERRDTGAFYTPQDLVERVTNEGLMHALESTDLPQELISRALGGDADAARSPALIAPLRVLTILDPACGSGAFLVHALEKLAALDKLGGDPRPLEELRRERLTHAIFGVDLNPVAVWLCELRLWLSVVVECGLDDARHVRPLPNLDRNVRVGDALAAGAFGAGAQSTPAGGAALGRLRERYARATGTRKASLARALDREERARALAQIDHRLAIAVADRRELVIAQRARDLFGQRSYPAATMRTELLERRERVVALRRDRRRLLDGGALPFRFSVHFADVAQRGGFDVVLGNPPWVRLHRIPAETRQDLRREFTVYRQSAWSSGADRAKAGSGFAAQVDLAALFVERSLALLRPGGAMALLLPAKLWRTLAGGGVRRLLLDRAQVRAIEDWSEGPVGFDAVVYPSLLVASSSHQGVQRESDCVRVAVHRGASRFGWTTNPSKLALDDSPGSPWLLLPDAVRAGVDRLRAAGVPFADAGIGRPQLGVKSGCNDAFVVSAQSASNGFAEVVASDGRRGRVESEVLRPLLGGHALAAWRSEATRTHVIWTHDDDLLPLDKLPVLTARWLAPWRRRLERRTDARGRGRWWSLFRVEAADSSRPRVVWGDVGRAPRAVVLHAGDPTVPLNSCYVVRCPSLDDAHAIAALLNGPVAAAWLAALAEPARGGYRRYMGWTMSLLPVPHDWPRARELLAPLGTRAWSGDAPSKAELLDAALRAYRVRADDLAPLIAWFGA
jgi:hypothetical protein